VGYERGWATWSMGGRLSGWGIGDKEGEGEGELEVAKEGFMNGVTDMVSLHYHYELSSISLAMLRMAVLVAGEYGVVHPRPCRL
jgi:hypothetical protein